MSRTILVTGAAGFIGSHCVDKLLELGYRVIGLDNFDDFYNPVLKRDNIEHNHDNSNFLGVVGDIRSDEDLDNIFSVYKITDIIHLAARAGVRPSWDDPFLYENLNVTGTIKLLQKAAEKNVEHFIYGSSSSVYGINEDIPFAPEHTTQKTISPYAASKLAAEGYVHAYHHRYGFKATTLRFFTVYGPRQRPEMAIHKFTRLMIDGQSIPIFGNGESRRDYTYVDDIIQGLAASLSRKGGPFEILNLGSTDVVKLNRLVDVIADAVGVKPVIERYPDAPGDVPITNADITRSTELLGYRPTTRVEEGVPKFVEWFRVKRGMGII